VPRSAVFFETKLKHNLGRDAARQAIQRSLQECGLEYVRATLRGAWAG